MQMKEIKELYIKSTTELIQTSSFAFRSRLKIHNFDFNNEMFIGFHRRDAYVS